MRAFGTTTIAAKASVWTVTGSHPSVWVWEYRRKVYSRLDQKMYSEKTSSYVKRIRCGLHSQFTTVLQGNKRWSFETTQGNKRWSFETTHSQGNPVACKSAADGRNFLAGGDMWGGFGIWSEMKTKEVTSFCHLIFSLFLCFWYWSFVLCFFFFCFQEQDSVRLEINVVWGACGESDDRQQA